MVDEFIRKQDAVDMCGGYGCLAHLMSTIKPADVVQVVRCQNCKYRESDDFCVGRGFPYQLVAGDEFCSRAKTKEHIND